MNETQIVGVATLPPDTIVPGHVKVLTGDGPLNSRVTTTKRRGGAEAIAWSAEDVSLDLVRAAGRHDLRAWAYGRQQGRIQVVEAIYLAGDACGAGNCWPATMPRAALPAELGEWWQCGTLAAMGLRPQVRTERMRPHGLGITRLAIKGSIRPSDDLGVTSVIRLARGSIELELDSKGGDIGAATRIADALEAHEYRVTIRIREASSAASLIAVSGDARIMSPDGFAELHRPFFPAASTLPAAEQERILAQTFTAMADRLARRTGQPSSTTRKWLASNVTLDASAARQVNFATTLEAP